MQDSDQTLTFIIVSFCLAIVLILMKDRIPSPINKYLALFAVVMVVMSFVFLVLAFLNLL